MLKEEEKRALVAGALEFGVELPSDAVSKLSRLLELLYEWNQKINLTRIPEKDAVTLHILDSLSACRGGDFPNSRTLLDIGTGAGFPGLVLKIAFPHLEVLLLDSTKKKLTFIETVIDELELENVRTIHARAEDLTRDESYRGKFSIVTARAVSELCTLIEWTFPFVAPGGTLICLKGGDIEEEFQNALPIARRCGGDLVRISVSIPGSDISRALIVSRPRGR